MEPFYFGKQGRRLFAHYHAPGIAPRAEGVVIAPPLFAEYFRSHSCLRRLALGLAGRGLHVLRFDYFGTGDSEGDFEATTPADWEQDIRSAIAELEAISGVRKIRLAGVRLGATLAARVAATEKIVNRLAIWDPVVDGRGYLDAMRATQLRLLDAHPSSAQNRHEIGAELVGFRVTDRMLEEIEHLAMPAWDTGGLPSTLLVLTGDEPDEDTAAQARGAGASVECAAFDCDWTTYSEAVLFPHEIIKTLTERI